MSAQIKQESPLPFHTVSSTTEYNGVSIQRLFNCVTQTSLLCKDAQLHSKTPDVILINRIQEVNKVISDILKSQDRIPYLQKIELDIKQNQRFLVSTSVAMAGYKLDVGLLYKANPDGTGCVCQAKMKVYGVCDPLIKKIALAVIREENKKCRKHELTLLKLGRY
jgi:hypothetical protein